MNTGRNHRHSFPGAVWRCLSIVLALSTTAGATGPDVIVGELFQTRTWGTIGNITSFSIGTISCNKGDMPVSWIASNNQHPMIAQNLFRLKDGQFEHLGQSWLQHGFIALAGNYCGFGCTPPGTGALLGIGCSTSTSSNLNGSQSNLGPKFEVNAHTGSFLYPFFLRFVTGDAIFKRLQVRNTDLNPVQNAGALYFVESQYVTPDDAAAGNQDNNASYRRVTISAGPTGTACNGDWCLNLASTTQREQSAIRAWRTNDSTVMETNVRVPGEGLFFLAADATDLGDGFWHYEYALQNLNSDRSAGSFRVPLPATATVRNIGFHDVDYHSGEPFSLTDWSASTASGSLVWSTEDFTTNADANALRWGTLYNFRFECDAGPSDDVELTIGLFKPGTPTEVGGISVGPAGPPAVCGNNVLERGEDCDPPDGVHCDALCQWICGDGVVQEGEECEPPGSDCCDASCHFEPADTACADDGNSCTDDVCDGAGTCEHRSDDTNDCDDGAFCNGQEHCSSGECISLGNPCIDDGDECTTNLCDPETGCNFPDNGLCGACCIPGNGCINDGLASTCENVHGGTFLGEGSVCEPLQGCCKKDESGVVSCSDIDPRCCAEQQGLPMGSTTSCLGDSDGNGMDDLCEPSIPTVSQWGLVVLTLLLMTMWKIRFGRTAALNA